MENNPLNSILQDDQYFCRVANQHHKDVKKANTKQSKPTKKLPVIGSLAIVLCVLYWLATLGV